MRGPRLLPTDLNRLIDDTLQLYAGVLQRGTRADRAAARRRRCRPCGSTPSRCGRSSSTSSTTRSRRSAGRAAPPRPNGGRPTIVDRDDARRANGVVRLVVSDNGPGVPPADRDKLFMPYYSTKGRGSGLGLAIVRRIVVEHGGGIEVGDGPAGGTIVHRRTAGRPDVMSAILIVDDEAGVRASLGGVLRDEGYAVDTVDSGEACLEQVGAAAVRRGPARHLAAGHRRPGDARAAARAARRRAGHHDLRPREHRVGRAATKLGRVRLHREAAVAREDRARRAQRAAAAAARGRESRAARACRSPLHHGRRERRDGASCASRSRWRRRPTAAC